MPDQQPLPFPRTIETGWWCAYEGIYFTDEDEIENGHYGYPCGDGDHERSDFIPHDVIEVAVVAVEEGLT